MIPSRTFLTLLPEFVVIDSNNWYLVPLKQTAGTVREIVSLSVVDGFGVVTEIGPSDREDWQMFSLSPAANDASSDGGATSSVPSTGVLLFVPNIALDVLDNDELEEIRFLRDEDANLSGGASLPRDRWRARAEWRSHQRAADQPHAAT